MPHLCCPQVELVRQQALALNDAVEREKLLSTEMVSNLRGQLERCVLPASLLASSVLAVLACGHWKWKGCLVDDQRTGTALWQHLKSQVWVSAECMPSG